MKSLVEGVACAANTWTARHGRLCYGIVRLHRFITKKIRKQKAPHFSEAHYQVKSADTRPNETTSVRLIHAATRDARVSNVVHSRDRFAVADEQTVTSRILCCVTCSETQCLLVRVMDYCGSLEVC
ncbi:hypothetical protein ACJJTC_017001 [Scirpophaga incertulas]